MERKDYLPRLVDQLLRDYLQVFGAVVVEGPKWCGKTWTSVMQSGSEFLLGDPAGNFQNLHLAEMSPGSVLSGEVPRLLDEWQAVPMLWDAVRAEVDARNVKGQFILTGSATPNRRGILHSGAGRIGRLRMRPMSLYEAQHSSGKVSLEEVCQGRLEAQLTGEVHLEDLARLIVRGGWPGNQKVPDQQAGLLAREYIRAVLENDVYQLDETRRDNRKIHKLLRSLARNESTVVSNRTLKKDIREMDGDELSDNTIIDYLDILRRLFLLDNQLPFAPAVRSSVRIHQAEKRHLADPSLTCALLGLSAAALMHDLETFGSLFEALCERDLRIYANCFGAELYHYRDYQNHEIDAVIEMQDRSWAGFEIKLGANQIDQAARNLIRVNQKIADAGGPPAAALAVICGLSNAAYKRPDGVMVIPVTALKN